MGGGGQPWGSCGRARPAVLKKLPGAAVDPRSDEVPAKIGHAEEGAASTGPRPPMAGPHTKRGSKSHALKTCVWIYGETARNCIVSASRAATRNRRPHRWEDGGWNNQAVGRPGSPLVVVGRPHMGARAVCSWFPPPLANSRPTQSPTRNSPSGTAAAGPHPHSKARKRTQSPAGTSLPGTAAAGPHPLSKAQQRTHFSAGNGPPVSIRHQTVTAAHSLGLGTGTTRHVHRPMSGARNLIRTDDWSTGPE